MKLKVGINNISIEEPDTLNSGEYNIHQCIFEFDDVYTGLVKKAQFSNDTNTYQVSIENNECMIPYEVLTKDGKIEIGVYAYEVDGTDLVLRYSPKPITKYINIGSYKENYDNYEEVTATDKEQMEQALSDMETKMDNLNIDAEKVDKTATITITKKDGTQKEVEITDGVGIDYNWSGTSLGIKKENEQDYDYVDLKGPKGDAGAIKMIIVAELPETGASDTIYLVPLETPTEEGNNYAEYVYINNAWELLGKIGVQVDLTDYVKNTDYATSSVGGVVKSNEATYGIGITQDGVLLTRPENYNNYSNKNNYFAISKGTLENVITGKGLVSNKNIASTDNVGVIKLAGDSQLYTTSTGLLYSYLLTYAQYTSKSNYAFINKGTLDNVLNAKIGDIESILETLDIGTGV